MNWLRRIFHRHQWAPWHEILLPPSAYEGRKVFSNGEGCRVCRKRKP